MAGAEGFLDARRERLADPSFDVNGIEGIEVDPADQTRLLLRFVHPLPGEAGGIPALGTALTLADLALTSGSNRPAPVIRSIAVSGRVMTITTSARGDLSPHLLRLRDGLSGFDPILNRIEFLWRLTCQTGDCAAPPPVTDLPPVEPPSDLLARDYESCRRAMLDRMAVTLPEWQDRNPADIGVTLVELLAALGDGLSYRLDRIGTEYALERALLRVSAARHARLVGYRMSNGVSARVLAQVRLAPGVTTLHLPAAGTSFLTRAPMALGPVISGPDAARAEAQGAVAFEPLFDADLNAAHERMALHHWGDPGAVLARGSTSFDLSDPARALTLKAGDVLVLAQVRDPDSLRASDADPALRQAVRLSRNPVLLLDALEPVPPPGGGAPVPLHVWRCEVFAEDALTFDLATGKQTGGPMAVALGNLVLADHGFTLPDLTSPAMGGPLVPPGAEDLGLAPDHTDPEIPPAPGQPDEPKPLAALDRPRPYRPELARRDLAFADRPDPLPATLPGARLLQPDPQAAQAQITLASTLRAVTGGAVVTWTARRDLLGQPATANVFVPEVESDGRTRLRFGRGRDGAPSTLGREPAAGQGFTARYRVGSGSAGNIGAEALAHLAASDAGVRSAIAGVSNPLPARGGQARETVAEVRQRAPTAFQVQRRAVTLADYEARLAAHPDVQRAAARQRWLGSWTAIFLSVDRRGGLPVDAAFRTEMLQWIEPVRMMGHDVTIDAPIFVPIDLVLNVCAASDHFADQVARALADRLGSAIGADGRPGLFHPDLVTFGETIFLSRLYAAALEVAGVADVSITVFSRAGSQSGLDSGALTFGPREVPLLANDPNRPMDGRITISMHGGR